MSSDAERLIVAINELEADVEVMATRLDELNGHLEELNARER